MHIRNGAFGVAAVAIALLASGPNARAQWAGGGAPIAIDFSGRSGIDPSFVPSLGRHASLPSQVAALSSVPTATTGASVFPVPPIGSDVAPQPSLLQHLFASGIADLVRGKPGEAAEIFAATASATDQAPQLVYLTALAQLLSDFDHRDQALPLAKRATAQNPDHALYRVLAILADRDLSLLAPDGALDFTPAGATQLHAAIARLPAQTDAYNGSYLGTLLASVERTRDPALPERLTGFAAMLGDGRPLALAGIDTPQALGRLFVLSIPPEVLARGEARLLTGLGGGFAPTPTNVGLRASAVVDRGPILLP